MGDLMQWAHGFASFCALGVGIFLLIAGRSVEFRIAIGPTELERSFNFQLVALFLFALALDLGIAPFGVNALPHLLAIALVCVSGALAVIVLTSRVVKWLKR